MKYVITGGAGFIGSHITKKLVERGDVVTVIDNMNTVPNHIESEILSCQKTSSQFIAPPSVHISKTIVEKIISK